MRIIFIGTVKLSEVILNEIINFSKINNSQFKIKVISSKNNKFNSDKVDLTNLCSKNKIEIFKTDKINSRKSYEQIKIFKPDIGFCVGWSQLINEKIIKIPKKGFIGYHPSLLPKNRGRHPLIWALNLGLKQTGSSFFFLKKNADSGNIVSQKKIKINYSDNAETLYNKMIITALSQINYILKKLKNNKINSKKQNSKKSNYWRKRSENDSMIDFRMSNNFIYNLVRALHKPYPGAYFFFKKKKIKVWKVKLLNNQNYKNIEPGRIIKLTKEKNPIVKCGENCIELLSISPNIKFKPNECI